MVANPPSDGISSLAWSPVGNFLVATAWDGDVRERIDRGAAEGLTRRADDAGVLL